MKTSKQWLHRFQMAMSNVEHFVKIVEFFTTDKFMCKMNEARTFGHSAH